MPKWYDSQVILDSTAPTAGEAQTADASEYHTPAVCVALEDLGGATDDTLTLEIVGAAGTYRVDQRTLSGAGSYVVDVPQCDTVRLTSANGSTISAEVRNNPR